jgi:hypothetical protein
VSYIPNPTDATQPVGTVKAKTAAAEFRAIKAYLNSIVAAGLPPLVGIAGASLTVNDTGTAATWSSQPNTIRGFELFI